MITLKLLAVLHILGTVVFVGSNVLMARLVKRLEAIPPREAARLSELLGRDMAVMNSSALVILGGTGFWRLGETGLLGDLFRWTFISSAYGAAVWAMLLLWLGVLVSAGLMTLYFRPRLSIKLPYNASRQAIEDGAAGTMASAAWIARLSTFNLVVGLVTVLVAGFLRYGGFGEFGGGDSAAASGPSTTASPAATTGDPVAGKAVFAQFGCTECHNLAIAVQPSAEVAFDRVTNGKTPMPAFAKANGGPLDNRQVADVVAYFLEETGG